MMHKYLSMQSLVDAEPRVLNAAAALLICAWSVTAANAFAATAFDAVAPIFARRCAMCHSGAAAPLGLRLDTFENVVKGSQKGPVVKAGNAAASELVRRIRGESLPRMPLTGPPYLEAEEIALIEKWVAEGLANGPAVAGAPEPARPKPGEAVAYRHVAPILLQRCAKCHAPNGILGAPPEGYRLDTWE
jgi:mono/diheme cytochrome c family protein